MRFKRVLSLLFCILMLAVNTAAAGSPITSNIDVDGGWKYVISNDYVTGSRTHPDNLFVASNSNSPNVVANATFDGTNTVFANSTTEGNLYIGKLYPEANTRYRIQVNITGQDSDPTIYLQNGMLFTIGIYKNRANYVADVRSTSTTYPKSIYLTDSRYADLTIEYSANTRTCRIWETSNPAEYKEITCYSNQVYPNVLPSSNLFDCELVNCGSGATFKILKFEQLTPKKIVTVDPSNDKLAFGFDGPRGNYTDGKNWLKEHGQRATLWLDLPYIQNDAALRQDCLDLVDNWGWEVGIHFTHSLNALSWEAAVAEMDTETNSIASIFGHPVLSWCSLGNEESANHTAYMYTNRNSIHRNSPVSNADAISGEDYMVSSSSVSSYTNIKFWDIASQHGTFKPVYEHSVKTPLEEPNSIDYNDFARIMTNYTTQGIKIIPFGEWYYTAVNTNLALDNVLFSDSDSHFNFNTHGYNTNVTVYDPNGEGVWFENGSAITTYLDGTNETQLAVNTSSSKTIQKLKAAFVSDGNLAVTPSIWNSTGDYRKKWNEYSSSSITTNYVIGDFPADAYVIINCDGAYYTSKTANSTGYINWNYPGKSGQHEFDISSQGGVIRPVANFSQNATQGFAPLTVQFTDLSQNADNVSWDFENDGIPDSLERNPMHTYVTPGTYTVNLTAINANGTSSKTFSPISVWSQGENLVAIFSATPTSGSAPLSVAFIDMSTGYPTSWKWVFGDGTSSTEQNSLHVYNKTGLYAVTLTVTKNGNTSAVTKSNYIAVSNGVSVPGTAFSATPASGAAPLSVNFADLSSGSPTAWKWTFGDGNTSTQQNPTYVYTKAGLYTVSLNASNAAGSKILTKSNYIVVSNAIFAPVADFSATPAFGTAPLNVNFTDASAGSPTAWKWTFGDGNTSAQQNPAYVYTKPGLYTVSLNASNAAGSNTMTKTSYIAVSSV